MNVYIVENDSAFVLLDSSVNEDGRAINKGSVYIFLREDKTNSSKSNESKEEGRFPWAILMSRWGFLNYDSNSYFKIQLELSISKRSSQPTANVIIDIQGDFIDILKHVYPSDSLPEVVMLKLNAVLELGCGDEKVEVNLEKRSTATNCRFRFCSSLNAEFVEKFVTTKTIYIKKFTLQLAGVDAPSTGRLIAKPIRKVSSAKPMVESTHMDSLLEGVMELMRKLSSPKPKVESTQIDPPAETIEELTERIFMKQILSDFNLVGKNGFEIPCHKVFLAAQSPVFEQMFQTSCNKTEAIKCQLSLSEESLKAFLDFVYSFKIEANINSTIAIELLKISHEKQMLKLEKVVKDLLKEKSESWFDFDASLHLFFYCNKLAGYEDLEIKLVKAITMKRDEMRGSDVFKELLSTDTDSAIQLIQRLCCSQE